MHSRLFLGIDVGTSGIRAVVIDQQKQLIAQAQQALPESQPYYNKQQQIIGFSQQAEQWWQVLSCVITQLARELENTTPFCLRDIYSLAIDGTSGTVLLADSKGQPLTDALMYNDQRAITQAQDIAAYAPADTAAIGPTSGLAKILWLYQHHKASDETTPAYALNQTDWLSGKLINQYGLSDHNNAMKMGYDVQNDCWPSWLVKFLRQHFKQQTLATDILPDVHTPGEPLGKITSRWASEFGFNPQLFICAGTTDSTAAIMATGIQQPAEAVTSLGSTLVMKVISEQPVFNARYGVYSQPYGKQWLVGGGSSSGGAVLKSLFCAGEISDYSEQLLNKIKQGQFKFMNLNYYPLLMPGERFPVQDPQLQPILTPRPVDDVDFFQAILEGMADIEAKAYQVLLELGAPYPKLVSSIGGGAFNQAWRYIREQKLGVPVLLAEQQQAAAGAALLAQSAFVNNKINK